MTMKNDFDREVRLEREAFTKSVKRKMDCAIPGLYYFFKDPIGLCFCFMKDEDGKVYSWPVNYEKSMGQ